MNLFQSVRAMFKQIRGIPEDFDTAAGQRFEYLPESELGDEIHASDGGDWEPWRTDPDGEPWLRREIRGVEPAVEIMAFDADADDDELPDADARSAFYRESSILRSIVARREEAEDHEDDDFDIGGDDADE